jgi:hypothetical protein
MIIWDMIYKIDELRCCPQESRHIILKMTFTTEINEFYRSLRNEKDLIEKYTEGENCDLISRDYFENKVLVSGDLAKIERFLGNWYNRYGPQACRLPHNDEWNYDPTLVEHPDYKPLQRLVTLADDCITSLRDVNAHSFRITKDNEIEIVEVIQVEWEEDETTTFTTITKPTLPPMVIHRSRSSRSGGRMDGVRLALMCLDFAKDLKDELFELSGCHVMGHYEPHFIVRNVVNFKVMAAAATQQMTTEKVWKRFLSQLTLSGCVSKHQLFCKSCKKWWRKDCCGEHSRTNRIQIWIVQNFKVEHLLNPARYEQLVAENTKYGIRGGKKEM